MYYPFFDWTIIIILPGLLLAMYAQAKVQSTFARYAKVAAQKGLTGAQVAREILESQGLDNVGVEMIQGKLTDHYDPRTKVVRLSPEVYRGTSLASIGVAAHETGHAMQHSMGYLPLNLRTSLVPVANFGSNLAFPLFFIGLFIASPMFLKIGIYLFAAVVLFQVITLPVEFNASQRALAILEGRGFVTYQEVSGTRKVLHAAALTYVAAALVGILNLLRLLALAGIFRRND